MFNYPVAYENNVFLYRNLITVRISDFRRMPNELYNRQFAEVKSTSSGDVRSLSLYHDANGDIVMSYQFYRKLIIAHHREKNLRDTQMARARCCFNSALVKIKMNLIQFLPHSDVAKLERLQRTDKIYLESFRKSPLDRHREHVSHYVIIWNIARDQRKSIEIRFSILSPSPLSLSLSMMSAGPNRMPMIAASFTLPLIPCELPAPA